MSDDEKGAFEKAWDEQWGNIGGCLGTLLPWIIFLVIVIGGFIILHAKATGGAGG